MKMWCCRTWEQYNNIILKHKININTNTNTKQILKNTSMNIYTMFGTVVGIKLKFILRDGSGARNTIPDNNLY